jgi:hypothetical protein
MPNPKRDITRSALRSLLTGMAFFCLQTNTTAQPNITVKQPYTDTLLCRGRTFILNYVATQMHFNVGNTFTVQLSDASGNFFSPVTIGVRSALESDTIHCTIPANTVVGTGYRIRIVASDSPEISPNNGVNIRISQPPVCTASNNGPVCIGILLQLNATGGVIGTTYAWKGPNAFNAATQNPTRTTSSFNDSGYYVVTATYYGCSTKDSTKAIVTKPKIDTLTTNSPVCSGGALGFSISTKTPNVTFTWTGPNGYNYHSPPCPTCLAIPGDTRFGITQQDAGRYYATINLNGCIDTASFWAVINPRPNPPFISSNSPVCLGDSLRLFLSTADTGIYYQWYGPNGFSSINKDPFIPNVTGAASGSYNAVTIFNKNGCLSLADTTDVIIGTPLGLPVIAGTTEICKGDSLKLTANGTLPGGTYTWTGPGYSSSGNNNVGIADADVINTGFYTVTQKLNGCTSPSASIYVLVRSVPEPIAGSNSPICVGNELLLTALHVDSATYTWQGPNGFIASTQNPVRTPVVLGDSGEYIVTARIANCIKMSKVKVVINPVPSITTINSNSPVCEGKMLNLYAESDISNSNFSWNGPLGFTSSIRNPSTVITMQHAGYYYVRAEAKGCISPEDSTLVSVKLPPEKPEISTNSPLKLGEDLKLHGSCPTHGAELSWTGPNSFTAQGADISIKHVTEAASGSYILNATHNGCVSSAITIIIIHSINQSFNIWPNPNHGSFVFKAQLTTDAKVGLQITNTLGQIVYKELLSPVNRKIEMQVHPQFLVSGVYRLRIITDGETKVLPFVVN